MLKTFRLKQASVWRCSCICKAALLWTSGSDNDSVNSLRKYAQGQDNHSDSPSGAFLTQSHTRLTTNEALTSKSHPVTVNRQETCISHLKSSITVFCPLTGCANLGSKLEKLGWLGGMTGRFGSVDSRTIVNREVGAGLHFLL